MDFSKFDKMMNLEDFKAGIKEAEENQSGYEEVPYGTYEVKIEKMELTESKKGDPMFTCWFKIISDYQKGRLLFMNQVIAQPLSLHIVNEFLRSLESDVTIQFDNFCQYGDLIFSVLASINAENLGFKLEYGERKGYPTFKISEVFVDEKIPF